MPENFQILQDYNRSIIRIYNDYNLQCVRGLNGEYEIDGRNISTWHDNVTKAFQQENKKFNFKKNLDDLILISDEILYFVANTILYEPYINDPIKDKFPFTVGEYIYPNDQNMFSKMYDMFIDVSFEKLYNFWDRIGDLIAACIPTGLTTRRIYFSTVIDKVPSNFREIDSFKKLENYKNSEYKDLSVKRREIVHYFSTGTNFFYDHALSKQEESAVKEMMEKRRGWPQYLTERLLETINGFKNTLDFLNESQKLKQ